MKSAAMIAAAALALPHIPTPGFLHKPLPVPVPRINPKGHQPDQHSDAIGIVHYKMDGKLMLVPVMIDQQGPYMFVVDSAASRTVVDAGLARKLKLKTRKVRAADGQAEVAALWGSTVKVKGVPVFAPQAYVTDLAKGPQGLRLRAHHEVRGLLGAELFRAYVVRLEPRKRTMRIYHPAKFRPTTGATVIPLSQADGKLYVPLSISARGEPAIVHPARVDTGSEVLVADAVASGGVPAGAAVVADSLGRRVSTPATRLHAVKVAPYALYDVWGATEGGPAIGMEWLRRFIVTFDAPHGRMYLEPTSRSWDKADLPR